MTREEQLKMLEMRLDGYTTYEIAEQFGITHQCVSQILKRTLIDKKNQAADKCIYPGLRKWLFDNNVTAYRMNHEIGLVRHTNGFYRRLQGETKLNIDEIKAIIKYTGRSFEELFGGESE